MDIRTGENTISGVYSFRPHKLLVDGVECEAIEIGAAGAIPEAALASIATDGLETEQGTFVGYTQHTLTTVTFIKPPVTAEKVAEEKDVVIATVLGVLNDDQALQFTDLYPVWMEGMALSVGDRVQHGGALYRVQQAHMAQSDWTPDTALSMFSRINTPGDIPAWVTGQSYAKDVQVTRGGKTWLSMVDNNVWEPGASGVFDSIWLEVVE